jgi:threonine synthase
VANGGGVSTSLCGREKALSGLFQTYPWSHRRWLATELQSALTVLACSRCSREYDPDRIQHLCACGAPLIARYDLAAAAASLTRTPLGRRAHDLWRFRELLPVRREEFIVSLGESPSPILDLPRVNEEIGVAALRCKDEAALPGGSFKARGAAVGLSRARELGVDSFAMPTNGNAGSAWALYAARAGMQATIAMPAQAPAVHRMQCSLAGAKVTLVQGSIADAGRVIARAVATSGIYDASTLKEPYRIEGKKTLGFEIAEQFGWDLPDAIVYPTGGGVGLIGMHKAFVELQGLGLLGPRLPRFYAVQSTGCAPIVEAWQNGRDASDAWRSPSTIAFGINVPKAIGDFIVLRILRETGGGAIAVDDACILEYQRMLVEREGLLACPEGGATLAALAQARRDGLIGPREHVLLINTGSGAQYPDVPYPALQPIEADDESQLPSHL